MKDTHEKPITFVHQEDGGFKFYPKDMNTIWEFLDAVKEIKYGPQEDPCGAV